MTWIAAVNETALVVFAAVVAITSGHQLLRVEAGHISHRLSGPSAAASRGRRTALPSPVTTCRAASFLGIAGLIFLFGFDGFLYSVAFLVAFLTGLFLLAERMRNSGKYTIADVLAFRLRSGRPAPPPRWVL